MDSLLIIFLFVLGFAMGGLFVWLIRQNEIKAIQKGYDELKSVFGNLSKEALDQNCNSIE